MKLMMIDLDGTLFDTRMVNYLAYQEAIGTYGYSLDYEYFCRFCNGKHYLDFLPSITTTDSNILEDIHERKKAVYTKYLDHAIINQALADIMRLVGNEYKVALVTTASRENTYNILEYFDMIDCFDLILTCEDIINTKPNPEGYLKAMKCFNSLPEECIIFEDSDVGIEAARKTGAMCFVVKGYN